jgi:hypothetical protein
MLGNLRRRVGRDEVVNVVSSKLIRLNLGLDIVRRRLVRPKLRLDKVLRPKRSLDPSSDLIRCRCRYSVVAVVSSLRIERSDGSRSGGGDELYWR